MSLKFLIVDDAAFVREVLKNILRSVGGVIVGEAENGEEAVATFRATQPDVVIMDLVMPTMNGMESAKLMRELRPDVKIIACSTVDQIEIIAQAKSSYFDDFVLKPFTKDQLLSAVTRNIDKIGEAYGSN